MPLVINIILFVIAVAAVSATRRLFIFELTAVSTLLTGKRQAGLTLYAVLTLPGTILHELSHWAVAEILRVETGEITILPRADTGESNQRLGSVMTGRTDPVRGFLIGLAPFVTGILALFILNQVLLEFWGIAPWWQTALTLYGLVVVGNSMLISGEDRRYFPLITILLILVIIILGQQQVTISPEALSKLARNLESLNLVLATAVVLNLILLGSTFGVRYLIQKFTGKVVTTRKRAV